MVGGAPRERHDGERGVLVGVAAERRAVVEEQVRHLPALVPLVGDRLLGLGSHDGSADFMDDPSAGLDGLGAVDLRLTSLAADGFDHHREGGLHVRGLLGLMV